MAVPRDREAGQPDPDGSRVRRCGQIGSEVVEIAVGDLVVGSFVASDNTCEICRAGFQSRYIDQVMMGSVGTQAEYARIPLADGTLVEIPG